MENDLGWAVDVVTGDFNDRGPMVHGDSESLTPPVEAKFRYYGVIKPKFGDSYITIFSSYPKLSTIF